MGCPAEAYLGDTLVFSITTHDASTGALTDADAPPTYRVYEDETAAAILTGTMAKLDDANTTGFYTEEITCSAANGFEVGKSYTVYIEATVSADTGGISYAFKMKAPIFTTAMVEAYAALGAAPTLAQILFEIRALLAEASVAGTVLTAKKLDGATAAATYTLNDGTNPTSVTRAS